MNFYEFWIGKDINLDELWDHFDNGKGYIEKYYNSELFLMRLTFRNYPPSLPLFNYEVVHKTIKALYHDIKYECLPKDQYYEEGPAYLYAINRASGIWELLVAQYPALLLVISLAGAYAAFHKFQKDDVESLNQKLEIIKNHFPNAPVEDTQAFIKAWNHWQRKKVILRLIEQGLNNAEISRDKFDGNREKVDKSLVKIELE